MMSLFRRKRRSEPVPAPAAAPEPQAEEQPEPSARSYEPWTPDDAAPTSSAEPTTPQAPAPDARPEPAAPTADGPERRDASEPGAYRPLDDVDAESPEGHVIEALRKVYDPEIPVNIFELGLIYGVDVTDGGRVAVTMTLTTPGCPVAEQMPGMVEHAVLEFAPEAREVEVDIVWDPPWNPSMMSDAAKLELGFY